MYLKCVLLKILNKYYKYISIKKFIYRVSHLNVQISKKDKIYYLFIHIYLFTLSLA